MPMSPFLTVLVVLMEQLLGMNVNQDTLEVVLQ